MISKNTKICILAFILFVLLMGWYYCPNQNENFDNDQKSKKKLLSSLLNKQTILSNYVYSIFYDSNPGRATPTSTHYQTDTPSYILQNNLLESNQSIADSLCKMYPIIRQNEKIKKDFVDILNSIDTSLINLITNLKEDDIDRNRSDYYNIIKRTSITRLYNDLDRLSVCIFVITGLNKETTLILLKNYYKSVNEMILGYSHGFMSEALNSSEQSNDYLSELYEYIKK